MYSAKNEFGAVIQATAGILGSSSNATDLLKLAKWDYFV